MTKTEISEKSNSYKNELNKCNYRMTQYQNSINSCDCIKKYYEEKIPQKQRLSKLCFIGGLISTPLSLVLMFFSPIIGAICMALSIISWERYHFFNYVIEKFEFCKNYFSQVIDRLSEKQSTIKNQKDYALEQIQKLENEIPDQVIEAISMIKDEEISNLAKQTLFDKCIEQTNNNLEV